MEKQLTLFKIRDLRKKDQFKIDDKYLNGYARVCKPVATAVYNSLCRHAEFHSQKAFPSQKLIAYQHNISVDTVSRAIKKLVEYNIVMIERERRGGKFINYVYTLLDKSVWKLIHQPAKTGYGEPQGNDTTWQKTIVVEKGTKDNKVYKDNKYINKENKEREKKLSPAEEMRLFLDEKDYLERIANLIVEKSGIQQDIVLRELYNFKSYWSELNKSGKKQRWELERTFELKRRLSTWFRNFNKFNKPKGKNIIMANQNEV